MTRQLDIKDFTDAPAFPLGWMVFQCWKGTKKPKREGYAEEATDDPAQHAAWFAEDPKANWAVHMGRSNLGVIDIDGGEVGEASLFQFQLDEGFLPDTREHRSARGGRHLIFSDPEHKLKNSASRLRPKIDTRGSLGNKTGYIVIPPSTFEGGEYVVTHDRPVADLPDFVPAALGREHERLPASNVPADLPENIFRAIRWLQDAVPAIEHKGGDTRTLSTLMALSDLGVSEDRALSLAIEHYNPRCDPPWDESELGIKVHNAYLYAENGFGCRAVVRDRLDPAALSKLLADNAVVAPEAEFQSRLARVTNPQEAYEYAEPTSLDDIRAEYAGDLEWVVADRIIKSEINSTYGPPGKGKSVLRQTVGQAVAAGVDVFGLKTLQMNVLDLTVEDARKIVKLREVPISKALGISDRKGLPWRGWQQPPFDVVLAAVEDTGAIAIKKFVEHLCRECWKNEGHTLVCLDTLADIAILNTNAGTAANAFLKKVLGAICREFDATIWIIAHPSKASMEDGSYAGGAVGWIGGVRGLSFFDDDWKEAGRKPWETDPGDLKRTWKLPKSNYTAAGGETVLYFIPGEPALTASPQAMPAVDTSAKDKADAEKLSNIWKIVSGCLLRGMEVSRAYNSARGPAYIATIMVKEYGASGMKPKDAQRLLLALEDQGKIRWMPRSNGHKTATYELAEKLRPSEGK